jgi:hypothetical protein
MTYIHKTLEAGDKPEFPKIQSGWSDYTVIQAYDKTKEGETLVTRNGTEFIRLRCEDPAGARVNYDLFLSEKASWKIDNMLVAAGIEFSPGDDVSITPETFEGAKFRGLVKEVTEWPDIDKVAPITATDEKAPVEAEAERLQPLEEDEDTNVPF